MLSISLRYESGLFAYLKNTLLEVEVRSRLLPDGVKVAVETVVVEWAEIVSLSGSENCKENDLDKK